MFSVENFILDFLGLSEIVRNIIIARKIMACIVGLHRLIKSSFKQKLRIEMGILREMLPRKEISKPEQRAESLMKTGVASDELMGYFLSEFL